MFRIRRIYDVHSPANRSALAQAQQILREQFSLLDQADIDKLPAMLMDPLKYQFRSILFAAEDHKGRLSGFAMLLHAPDLDFCYLDFISTGKNFSGRGIGGALYERVRTEAASLQSALFFECLPDDPRLCRDPEVLKQNRARLRFYERYGARPIINTKYETPVKEGDDNPPYLVMDPLDGEPGTGATELRRIVKAILERKYHGLCDAAYVEMVVESIQDNPVRLRPFVYRTGGHAEPVQRDVPDDKKIALVFNNDHILHHVHERGYVEAPVRVETILAALRGTSIFAGTAARRFGEQHITAVHEERFYSYLKKVCLSMKDDASVYPYVFPIRNGARPPKELSVRAGYYCIDTFTPLNRNAFLAARNAVDCALTAAREILDGRRLAYALVRPPGHHAEAGLFGGFCYLNSAAVAAHYLSGHGRVAVLDIDYHHGNGQQSIFYGRADVLTISVHGHPSFAYPYFTGFADERGEGDGAGYNLNIPLGETVSPEKYLETVSGALERIRKFGPDFLVVALGFDTAKGDPTGTWSLDHRHYTTLGGMTGALPFPVLYVQEGGYRTRTLGKNARSFFEGAWVGAFGG